MDVFSMRYSPELGYGFVNSEIIEAGVASTLVYESTYYKRIFDPSSAKFTSEKLLEYQEVSLIYHLADGVLQCNAGGRKLDKVLSIISQLFDNDITVIDIFVNISDIIDALTKSKLIFKILGFNIQNYRSQVGLHGKFMARVTEQNIAISIINEYGAEITDIAIEILTDFGAVVWKLSPHGRIVVRTDENILEEQVGIARNIVIECNNA